MSHDHLPECNPGNCDISGDEFRAREIAKARLAELHFPPHPVAPPVRSRGAVAVVGQFLLVVLIFVVAFILTTLFQAWRLP